LARVAATRAEAGPGQAVEPARDGRRRQEHWPGAPPLHWAPRSKRRQFPRWWPQAWHLL
jgi:hypothetical protein